MSSKITSVYDAILDELESLYPNKTRVPYPYSLADNNARFLIDGYGFTIGPANFEQFEFCNFMTSREVTVVLTKEIFRTDSDAITVDDVAKSLLESVYDVQKLFYSYNELNVPSDIAKVDISSVSGMEQVLSGRQSFLTMSASFNFFILENL
jgi:hypothetical protein